MPTQTLNQAVQVALVNFLQGQPGNPPEENANTLLQFFYLIQLQKLLGTETILPEAQRHLWLQSIREAQKTNGSFQLEASASEYSELTNTALALITLQEFDRDLKYPLYASRQFVERTYTEDWFARHAQFLEQTTLSPQDAIQSGKRVLYTGSVLLKAFQDGLLDDTAIDFFLNCCDARANPQTGFWLPGAVATDCTGLIDAFFRTQLYFFLKRQVPYPRPMIHSILSLQQKNGHFSSDEANWLLADLAAVTILAGLSKLKGVPHFRIRRALKRTRRAFRNLIASKTDWNLQAIVRQNWLCETVELPGLNDKKLSTIIFMFYILILNLLIESHPGRGRNLNPILLKMSTSPCFTYVAPADEY